MTAKMKRKIDRRGGRTNKNYQTIFLRTYTPSSRYGPLCDRGNKFSGPESLKKQGQKVRQMSSKSRLISLKLVFGLNNCPISCFDYY